MEPKRTLHSGNLVRGDRKLFMEKYYDPEKYTCFILLRDGKKKNELGDFRSKISYKRRSSIFYRL